MNKAIVFALLVAALFACSQADKESAASSKTGAAKQKEDGEKIYKNYCITCHGIYGDMGGSGALDLTVSTLTLDERIDVIANGRFTETGAPTVMVPFKDLLNEEKIRAVAEYTMKLKK